MKKTLAILLALLAIGGFAFAQGKVTIGLDGTYTLINQDAQAKTGYDANTYASDLILSGTDANATKGVDLDFVDSIMYTSAAAPAVQGYDAWFKMFNNVLTLKVGSWDNSDFEVSGWASYDAGYVGTAFEKIELQAYPVAGLTLYADLPISKTLTDVTTNLKGTDLFASYSIDKVGKASAWAMLDLVADANVYGGAFSFTGVENLTATASVNNAGTATTIGAWAVYTMGALTPKVEFDGHLTGSTFTLDSYAYAKYAFNANLSASIKVNYNTADSSYYVSGGPTYDFTNGVKIGATAKYASGNVFTWSVPLYFSVAF